MGFITTLIVGLIAGALAKLIMPGKQGGGIIMTMLLGVIGAVVAGFFVTSAGLLMKIVAATIGAIVVLIVYGLITKGMNKAA